MPPIREAWPELTLEDVRRIGLETQPKADSTHKDTSHQDTSDVGVAHFARHVRSINGLYDPRQFDKVDWSRLAALLNDPKEGLRGTFLCRTDGRSPGKEIQEEYESFVKEKEKGNQAKQAQGKPRDESPFEQDEAVTAADCQELSSQVAAAFALDGGAALSIVWAALESAPVIGFVVSLFQTLKVTVQGIKRIIDQVALSGLEATSVSVIEHEALKGAYALGTDELKRLGVALGQHLSSAAAGVTGLNVAVVVSAKLVELAVRCYLLLLEQARLHSLNTALATVDFTDASGRQRLRDNPELTIYLPFLPGSAAACVLGILPPGALRSDAPINQVVDKLGGAPADFAQASTLARAGIADEDARLVGTLVTTIAARPAPQPRWLLSRWDPIPLEGLKTDDKLESVNSARKRLCRILRMMEKAQVDCPLKLYRGDYEVYLRRKKGKASDPLAGMVEVHTVHSSDLQTKGIELMWSAFGTSKVGARGALPSSKPEYSPVVPFSADLSGSRT